MAKKSHDEFINEMKIKNSNIQILGEYTGANNKIICKCLIDNNVWSAQPSNLLSGKGCPQCARKKISNCRTISHEEFINNLNNFNKLNNTFWKTDDQYVNNRTPITFYCQKDGCSIQARPSNLLSGYYKCKECFRLNQENNLKEHIKRNNLPIKILGKYTGVKNSIKCKCTICNKIYHAVPNRILTNNAICRSCAYIKIGENVRTSFDEFINKLTLYNDSIEYIDGYKCMSKPVHVKCKKCGAEWNPVARSLFDKRKKGCPICNISKGENAILSYLEKNHIDYIIQKTFDNLIGVHNKKLRYDFYLPKENLLIEYQGIQHEKPIDFSGKGQEFSLKFFKLQQEHDKRKREYAKEHNINLLEIWYWDFDNIENILDNTLEVKEKKYV